MRNWEKVLPVLEALCERGQAARHGWTLDSEFLPAHQLHQALACQGLVELVGREDRAELSVLEGRARAVGGPPDPARTRHPHLGGALV